MDAKALPTSEPKHFAYIDAVRGLAFLAVLTVHVASSVGDFPWKDFLRGSFGVQLFFLASAITLCSSMAKRSQVDLYPTFYFYLRRLFRIAPLFWCALVFYWAFPNVMPSFWLGQWAPEGVHGTYYLLTAFFLHGWNPYTFNSIVPGGWSIAVEMTFYLFFPLLFYFLKTPQKTLAVIFGAILCLKMMEHVDPIHPHSFMEMLRRDFFQGTPDTVWDFFVYLWFPAQLPVFLIGFFVWHILKNDSVKVFVKNTYWAHAILIFCLMILTTLFQMKGNGIIPTLYLIVLALGGIVVAISGGAVKWLVNPVICYVGKISYSCYLVHFAALGITLKIFGVHLTGDSPFFEAGGPFSNLLLFFKLGVVTLVLTVIFSTLTLHLIENPGIALGRKLISQINRRPGK